MFRRPSMARSATRNKVGKDPAYLAFIHTLPCVVCAGKVMCVECRAIVSAKVMRVNGECPACGDEFPMGLNAQRFATEAAHVGDRGLSQKAPDSTAIPLCKQHHTEGKDAAHKLQKKFWAHHGLDRDALVKELQARYQERAA